MVLPWESSCMPNTRLRRLIISDAGGGGRGGTGVHASGDDFGRAESSLGTGNRPIILLRSSLLVQCCLNKSSTGMLVTESSSDAHV